MSAATPIRPPTPLERVDAAISLQVNSIAKREKQVRELEATLSISRTALDRLRASRTFLLTAEEKTKRLSDWLKRRILQHHLEPPLDPTDG